MPQKRSQSKNQMRNLSQYKDLTDEEFESLWEEKASSVQFNDNFDEEIKKKLEEFREDYDIDDLKINDREQLRALIIAIISLEHYERIIYELRATVDITPANVSVVDRIQKVMSDLRKDISKIQEDLNITRRIRKSDKEASVTSYLMDLKEKARTYYEMKSSYVFCEECNMLLGTVWTLYPDSDNKFSFKCQRDMDDGSKCGHVTNVTSAKLLEKRGTNKPEVTPESML